MKRPYSALARGAGLLGLLSAAFLLNACFTHTGHLDRMAHKLEAQLPATRFEPQFGLKFGRLSLGLAKGITNLALNEEELDGLHILRGVKKVEFATYKTVGASAADFTGELELSLRKTGWQTLARFREDGELGWIVYRMEEDILRNLVVCILSEEELTMVRLSGRLDRLITAAIQFARSELQEHDSWDEEAGEEPLVETH